MTAPGKRALVTGGTAGLGGAFVAQLVDSGFEVISLDKMAPDAAVETVRPVICDLSSRGDLDRVMPDLIDAGPYDLVVLNAGISATGRFEDIQPETHSAVLRVNAEAPMVMAAGLLSAGALKAGAALVFVSSLSHFTGYPGAATYAASKDALTVFAKSMRKAAKARGVSVTIAFPGPLRTEHAARHAPKGADASKRMDPELAAKLILQQAAAGRKTVTPGPANRFFALGGKLFPKPVTALMRMLIYTRLDR